MKKKAKKIFAVLLTLAFVLTGLSSTVIPASAEGEEYDLFIAFGGDKEASGDWGYSFGGATAANNTEGIQGTDAKIKVGETATVSLTLPSEAIYTWYLAPVLVAEGVSELDVDVQVSLDGTDITSGMDFFMREDGMNWWYEGTGDYTETQAVRLAGGYNEWAEKYISESPTFTTIEFTVTLNSLTVGATGGDAVVTQDAEGKFPVFIAFGGDKDADGDWGYAYHSASDTGIKGDVTAVDSEIGIGETATVSITLPSEVIHTWYLAPVVVAENVVEADFTVKVAIDGVDVTDTIDFGARADGPWWYEGTGPYTETQAIRLAGGYNEWGDKFMSEAPTFTTLEYTITCNTLKVGVQAAPAVPEVEIDLDGTYNAYLGVQTPNWYFRNSYEDEKYGVTSEYFGQVSHSNDDGTIEMVGGTFTDTVIAGNGTYTVSVKGLDFTPLMDDTGLFNLLFVSTDIPNSDKVTISDVTLSMDGTEITKIADAILDADSKLVKKVLLANTWNADVPALPFFAVPKDSIEITFTVSGFNYDKAADEVTPEVTATPEATATPEPTQEPAVDSSSDAVEDGGINPVVIIVIVVAVVAVAVVAGVVVSKKKK